MAQYIPERPFHWPPYYDYALIPPSADYPESSQRTTSSPLYDHRRSDYNLWGASIDSQMHAEDTGAMLETHPESPPASSVKVEPEDPDGCFIMELSSMSPSLALSLTGMNQTLAPPTEVPLRATQASKEMRKMMGVFRLNPFAMHSGEGRGVMPALWCGGGPLEEEPLIFEFQLDIDDESGDSQFDLVGSGVSASPTTDLLEEEAQLRSFSPSFELHPEDLRSEMGEEEHEQEQEDYTEDPDQQNEWSDADCGNQSEVDTSSTSHSVHTPSETRSAHTPFNESYQSYPIQVINPSVASSWDIDPYQTHAGEEHLPPVEKMEGGHKMHRVHTTSHPYLRRGIVNPTHLASSPSSSTHSLSQSYPHLHTTTTTTSQPQLNFGYPILHHPTTTTTTTTHHHHHYNNNNQVPSQNQQPNQSSYSQHPTTTTVQHDSMIISSAPPPPLELLIPHRPVENSMYSSSYMRSGRTLKLAEAEAAAEEDETSNHHHHPAGIVNEYNNPRGTASSIIYTSQHDTHHHHASGGGGGGGHLHQYEHSSSPGGHHVFSPSRRWSLPETIGGPFRSSGSTM